MTDSATVDVVDERGCSLRFKGSGTNGYRMTFETENAELSIFWWCPEKKLLIAKRAGVALPSASYHFTFHPEEKNYWAKYKFDYNVDECKRFCVTFLGVTPTENDRNASLADY